MPQQELRQAFELMKQGKKSEAIAIVRGVLQNDMNNVNAWLLMANLMDDERKKLKALERLLAINPEHGGALRMLQKLNPNDPRFAEKTKLEPTAARLAEKTKHETHDWSKLEKAKKPPLDPRIKHLTTIGLVGVIVLLVTAVALSFSSYILYTDDNGSTPEDVALAFLEALQEEDFATMRQMTCPAELGRVDEYEANSLATYAGRPLEISADLSGVTTERVRRELNAATIAFHGNIILNVEDEIFTTNFDQDADVQDVEWIWEHVRRIDGIWMICDGPDMVFH